MHLHLDPLGGVAGDMFAAALLDAWPELWLELAAALAGLALPHGIAARHLAHNDGVIQGSRFDVADTPHDHGHPDHHHRSFRDIRAWLQASPLPEKIRMRAIAIFALLAEAEGKVHGRAAEDVVFHEIGAWDSIVDIVAAAFLIERVGAKSWSLAPLPSGSGRVRTAHGEIPIPAPAVVLLLDGFPLIDDGRSGERVTPTGAAILRHLAPSFAAPRRPLRQSRVGHGFGTKRFEGMSNVLRVRALVDDAATGVADEVAVLRFEIDDQSPEELAIGLQRLRAADGVIDVLQSPAFGKKGRMLTQIQVLARPDALDAVSDRCFVETTTLGLRWEVVRRRVLSREMVTGEGRPRVKIATRPGGERTAKAELDDVRDSPTQAARARRRRQAERRALGGEEESDG